VAVEVVLVGQDQIHVSIVNKKVINLGNVHKEIHDLNKMVDLEAVVAVAVSIVVKMAINHLNVQNPKKLLAAVQVVAVVENDQMHALTVVKMVINHLNVQNQRKLVDVQVVVVEVLVSIVAKKVTDLSNVPNPKKLVVAVVENDQMHVSIVVKMAINHLIVQNQKKERSFGGGGRGGGGRGGGRGGSRGGSFGGGPKRSFGGDNGFSAGGDASNKKIKFDDDD